MLSTERYTRVRIGVGAKPHPNYDLADWVLGRFTQAENTELEAVLEKVPDIVLEIMKNGVASAQNRYGRDNEKRRGFGSKPLRKNCPFAERRQLMNSIPAKILGSMPEYRQIADTTKKSPVVVCGASTPVKAQLIAQLATHGGVVIAPDEASATKLTEELCSVLGDGTVMQYPSVLGDGTVMQYPEKELAMRPVETRSHEYELMRLSVLTALAKGESIVAVASVSAVLQLTAPPEVLLNNSFTINIGDEVGLTGLTQRLLEAGYVRSVQVEGRGQFSTRGGIVDFFPPLSVMPVRIELWGDAVDSISNFSVELQRRTTSLEYTEILPARELIYSSSELLEKLRACYAQLTEAQRERGGEVLLADIARLEQGKPLTVADKYVLNIYGARHTILSYVGNRPIFASELSHIEQACDLELLHYRTSLEAMLGEGLITGGTGETSDSPSKLLSMLKNRGNIALDSQSRTYGAPFEAIALPLIPKQPWRGELSGLVDELMRYVENDYLCIVPAGTARGAAALADDLERYGLGCANIHDYPVDSAHRVLVCEGAMSSGYENTAQKILVMPYGRSATAYTSTRGRRPKRIADARAISNISDISAGDYVVHPSHGIGQFCGIVTRQFDGIVKDYIQLQYFGTDMLYIPVTQLGDYVVHPSHGIGQFCGIVTRQFDGIVKDYIQLQYFGTDMLYIPVTQLDMVMRYVGSSENVRLSKLNSNEWRNTKARARASVQEIAKELVALYAQRSQIKGFAFPEDTEWQKDFEYRFEYDETNDQLRCISEIKSDMQSTVPMDRLLCGDVGFGKTEVALRAAFKCVSSGKQCAVLVPTTILAWQHFQTFCRRMDGFPISIELLSRFKTPKQQREIAQKLAAGSVDIVIGTHRILQKDIAFRDLGLCIIDEEQRFGVAHKEKFKQLRTNVDVLTLSATPIPRTLNMAMSGIRDISIINEAPQDRQPVQTYVIEYSDGLIAEAIRRELSRGGQVFYLHNRVGDIGDVVAKIAQLSPKGVRIASAHGQMSETELSTVWQQLLQQEIDILVCTTIIETGVDIPTCNTLIIEDADRMGLSQLYQLRGRVGRGARRAYAYFTFRKGRILTEVGEKRLNAIREFTSFGSGFRIAMRDLEIRGAGNILGAQQHGHMDAIGYELYLRMLDDAVAEQSGTKPAHTECSIDIKIPAHIPHEYIEEELLRVDMYKKIAGISSMEDYLDVTDELIDRFGEPPKSVVGLLDISLIRNTAASYGIKEISQRSSRILLYLETFNMQNLMPIMQHSNGKVIINASEKPHLVVQLQKGQKPLDAIQDVLGLMQSKDEVEK